MKVAVMYRNSWFGGDGWTYYPKTIEISDKCPICGKPRGKTKPYRFFEDGEWFVVDRWVNSCGHIDDYKDCLIEAKKIKGFKELK